MRAIGPPQQYKLAQAGVVAAGSVMEYGDSAIRIKRSEYIGEITSSVAFANATFPLNPGLGVTFPWASGIANNFQRWMPHKIAFELKSTSANALNSTNTALGKVVMATDYNVNNVPFSDLKTMLSTRHVTTEKPSINMYHAVECKSSYSPTRVLNIRNGDLTTGDTLKLYDWANFQLAVVGMQAASNIGSLWIHYDITLMDPILPTFTAGPSVLGLYRHLSCNALIPSLNYTADDGNFTHFNMITSGTTTTGNFIGLGFDSTTPNGIYMVGWSVWRDSGGVPGLSVTTITDGTMTPYDMLYNGGSVYGGWVFENTDSTNTGNVGIAFVQITGPLTAGSYIKLTSAGSPWQATFTYQFDVVCAYLMPNPPGKKGAEPSVLDRIIALERKLKLPVREHKSEEQAHDPDEISTGSLSTLPAVATAAPTSVAAAAAPLGPVSATARSVSRDRAR